MRSQKKDMVHFDRVYILVPALTSQKKPQASQEAMLRLVDNWMKFKKKYCASHEDDPHWQRDLQNIERMIAQANSIGQGGHGLVNVPETLEGVRTTFLELRRRDNVDYFIEHLTDCHGPMEEIALTAKGKKPADLTEQDIEKITKLLPDAKTLWGQVEAAEFDAVLFAFNAEQVKKLSDYKRAESQTLAQLQQALTDGDKPNIIPAAIAIKPSFANPFMLFGKFAAVEKGT